MTEEKRGITSIKDELMNLQKLQVILGKMSEAELRYLNREIVFRIREATSRKARELSLQWKVGDKAKWTHKSRTYTGYVIRVNPKTLTINGDDGNQWKVGYTFAKKGD